MDNNPLDPAGLRQMANVGADSVSNRTAHHDPASTDAFLLASAILNAAATIADELRKLTYEIHDLGGDLRARAGR